MPGTDAAQLPPRNHWCRERRPKPGQHSGRVRMQAHSSSKHFDGRSRRPVQQEFRSPREIVLLARIQFGGALILVLGGKRIIEFFIEIAEQVMQIGFIRPGSILLTREHSIHLLASVARSLRQAFKASARVKAVRAIVRIHLIGGLQQRNGLTIFPCAKVELAETMVRSKIARTLKPAPRAENFQMQRRSPPTLLCLRPNPSWAQSAQAPQFPGRAPRRCACASPIRGHPSQLYQLHRRR